MAEQSLFEFRLPDVGEGLEEAEIVQWKVSVGQQISVNQPIVEIESAKSLVELPTPFAGTVVELLANEGQVVLVGAAIIRIQINGTKPERTTDEAKEPTGLLVGNMPSEDESPRRTRAPRNYGGKANAPVVQAVPVVPAAPVNTADAAKPPVRKLAHELGVNLAHVIGTGPSGSITREDVIAASEKKVAKSESADDSRETRTPIRGVRRAMAEAMVASAFTAPHVTEIITVDVTKSMQLLDALRALPEFGGLRLSPLTLLARAICVAAKNTPEINSFWDEKAQEVVTKHYINLGIAAATERGLLVPNIKNAEQLSLKELAKAIAEVVEAARGGRTVPAQMTGGTMSITNIGVFGIDAGTPILPPGESAIISLGAVVQRPWVVDSEIVVRQVTTLALSFDHRLIDGAQGSTFLANVAKILQDPPSITDLTS